MVSFKWWPMEWVADRMVGDQITQLLSIQSGLLRVPAPNTWRR